MGRFWRSLTLAGLLFAASLLSGCSQPRLTLSPEELYALPTLPAKYTELNTQLSALLESGAEYAAPTSGANIQSVQLVDLDGDGREEAVAFFRNSSEEKPLKIYIFSADGDSYVQTDLIEGSGTSIYSIAYTDLDSDGRLELLVGWKATAELQVLEVYSLRPGGAELLVRREYVKYITADLNQDQLQELVILHADEEGDGVADYYVWQSDGNLSTQSAARLSITMAELNQQGRVTQGTLEGDIKPGDITFFRLQSTADCRLTAYVAQGEVLPVATRSFGSIGIFAIPEMGRFYRHVLIEKNFPHHGAVAFGHFGKALFEVFKYLGVEDIGFNQPRNMRYPGENPFA